MKDKIKEIIKRLYPDSDLPDSSLFLDNKEITFNCLWFMIKKDNADSELGFEIYDNNYCFDKEKVREQLNKKDGILLFNLSDNTKIKYIATEQCKVEIDLVGGMKKYLELE